MTVERLKPREAFAKYGATPRRPRLAELTARAAAVRENVARLRQPQDAWEEARRDLPGAEEALKALLLDEALGTVDAAALDEAKTYVKALRRIVAGNDVSGQIAGLDAEHAQLGQAIEAETEAAIYAELRALIATYHQHSKQALVAEAAIQGLREYALAHDDFALGTACGSATKLHPELFESGQRGEALGKVLATVRLAWSAFPAALQGDTEAQPAPLSEAVALLPVRTEEQDVADAA